MLPRSKQRAPIWATWLQRLSVIFLTTFGVCSWAVVRAFLPEDGATIISSRSRTALDLDTAPADLKTDINSSDRSGARGVFGHDEGYNATVAPNLVTPENPADASVVIDGGVVSLCLLVIARDEEANLRANLPLWRDVVSCYVIGVDDRTSDGTMNAIREVLPRDTPRWGGWAIPIFLIIKFQTRDAILKEDMYVHRRMSRESAWCTSILCVRRRKRKVHKWTGCGGFAHILLL